MAEVGKELYVQKTSRLRSEEVVLETKVLVDDQRGFLPYMTGIHSWLFGACKLLPLPSAPRPTCLLPDAFANWP